MVSGGRAEEVRPTCVEGFGLDADASRYGLLFSNSESIMGIFAIDHCMQGLTVHHRTFPFRLLGQVSAEPEIGLTNRLCHHK